MHKVGKENLRLPLWCESGHRRLGHKIYFSVRKFKCNLNSTAAHISGFQLNRQLKLLLLKQFGGGKARFF